jgi:hypothetical protein
LLETARRASARAVNSIMTPTYWRTGRRIVEVEQHGAAQAGYGDELIKRLAIDLAARFGRGLSWQNIYRMRSFYLAFAEKFSTPSRKFDLQNSPTRPVKSSELIFQAPSEKLPTASEELQPPAGEEAASLQAVATLFPLPWSHYVRLLSVKDETARRFYEAEALRGGWSVRQLDRQIGSQFYQRTLLSRNKAAMLRKGAVPQAGDLVTPEEEIKDPLVLEFLDLKDECSEHDLEEALIRKLEDFQQVRSAKPAAQDERLMAHSSPSIQSNSPIAFAPSSCAACSLGAGLETAVISGCSGPG